MHIKIDSSQNIFECKKKYENYLDENLLHANT